MDTIVDKWFSTREQKITWGISLAFFIIFPVYFANIAAFLPDNAMIDSSDSATGAWEVAFTETDIATSESTEFLMDGKSSSLNSLLQMKVPTSHMWKLPYLMMKPMKMEPILLYKLNATTQLEKCGWGR